MRNIDKNMERFLKMLIGCLIFFVVTLIFSELYGCNLPTKDATNKIEVGDSRVYTYIIDDCEYMGDLNGDSRDNYLTHKGNCKNPIHDTQTN